MNSKEKKRISRTLSSILRHQALKHNLPVSPEGYVPIDRLLKLEMFARRGVSRGEIEEVVRDNDKQRFTIDGDRIRANQGHSIPLTAPILKPITLDDLDQYPVVLHGTYFKFWPTIKENGLDQMRRTHIHLAKGKFGEVKSGVRSNVEVLIYLDLKGALEDGLEFFESDNEVVLCEGPIAAKYFSQVIRVRDGKAFDPDF